MTDPYAWHTRGYLPHYDGGKVQAITYRLADSLPAEVLEQLKEREANDPEVSAAIETYADAGHGSCLLREDKHAKVVFDAWMHFHGVQYRLHAWVIMPNHVHVLVEPLAGHSIGKIVSAWKSVSARKIGSTLSVGLGERPVPSARPAKSHLWQFDYYDRFIRNQRHHDAVVDYIHQNPVKAGLVGKPEDWTWSSAHSDRRVRV